MRLGLSTALKHESPRDWAKKMKELGCGSVVFPLDHRAEDEQIDAYVKAAEEYHLVIAEVGAWCNPVSRDKEEAKKNTQRCIGQLRLADRIGACCCVNVAGSAGERWDGAYKENFGKEMWKRTVESVQEIIDKARPEKTFYTLEPMPWMIPKDPEQYLDLIRDVNRERFGVHMDIANWITSPDKFLFHEDFMKKCFYLLGKHIKSCHLKDVRLLEDFTFQIRETRCGDGNLCLETYVKEIQKVNLQMPVIIEHLETDEEYISSIAYVRKRMKDAEIAMN